MTEITYCGVFLYPQNKHAAICKFSNQIPLLKAVVIFYIGDHAPQYPLRDAPAATIRLNDEQIE